MRKFKSYFLPFIMAVAMLAGCEYINDLGPSKFKNHIPHQLTTYKNQPIILSLLPKDSIKNKTTITISDPLHGTIAKDSLNNYVYTPDLDFIGNDSIFYNICRKSNCDSNVLIITVLELSDTTGSCNLEALNDTYHFFLSDSLNGLDTVFFDTLRNTYDSLYIQAYNLDVLGNDVICSGSITDLTIIQNPVKGNVKIVNNRLIYRRNLNTPFVDNFKYRFCILENGLTRCDEASVQVNVTR